MKIHDVPLGTMFLLREDKTKAMRVRAPGWEPHQFFECQREHGLYIIGHHEDGSIESYLRVSINWEHWKNPEDCQHEIKQGLASTTDGDAFP